MIEVLPQSHDATVGIRASGVLKHIDYEQTLIPLLDKTIAKHRRVRLIIEIADNFAGWELPAVWDDANFGLTHRADFAKIALVGGPKWVVWATRLFAPFIGGELSIFPSGNTRQAWSWIDAN